MKNLFLLCFLPLIGMSAPSLQVDISNSNITPLNQQEIAVDNMKVSTTAAAGKGRLRWNAQTNSFMLVEFSKMNTSVVGRWNLSYDVGCDGSKLNSILHLEPNGVCKAADRYPCEWMMTQDQFIITHSNTLNPVYKGKITGSIMSGSFTSFGKVVGCWKAEKFN